MTTYQGRTPWEVTASVWQALFHREFLARVSGDRLAWFWMLFEPIAMIAIMVAVRTVAFGRDRHIGGAEFIPWMVVGLLGFFLFRENMMRSIGSIENNRTLFTYRQIKPIDPVVVRCFLEGTLKSFIFMAFVMVGGVLGVDLFPDDFLAALVGWLAIWMLGLGIGLLLSAASALVPEIGRIARISSLPLLIISGAILPLNFLPHRITEYLLWNPIAHGIELLRAGFFDSYRPLEGVDPLYLWFWILGLLVVGLAFHIRFESRLKAQ